MLGRYDNFPENIHRIDTFTSSLPVRKTQDRIIQTLYDMNKKAIVSDEVDLQALRDCTVVFEAGVAEARSFNYLDETEMSKLQRAIKKEPLPIIDIFLAACYHKKKGEKKSPLKFDYFFFRTVFGKELLEVQVYHERGPRYVSPADLVGFIINKLNMMQSKKVLKAVAD